MPKVAARAEKEIQDMEGEMLSMRVQHQLYNNKHRFVSNAAVTLAYDLLMLLVAGGGGAMCMSHNPIVLHPPMHL